MSSPPPHRYVPKFDPPGRWKLQPGEGRVLAWTALGGLLIPITMAVTWVLIGWFSNVWERLHGRPNRYDVLGDFKEGWER